MRKEVRSAIIGMLKIAALLMLMLDANMLWLFLVSKVAAIALLIYIVELWQKWEKQGLLPDYWSEKK